MSDGRPIRFSVIIPTYDRSDLLLRAVASALEQDAPDTEIVVVDDGSRDEAARHTLNTLSEQPQIRCLQQSHRGAAVARNYGAAESTGDFLVFLDSDDELLPGCLTRFAAAIQSSGARFVSGEALLVDAHGKEIRHRKPEDLGPAGANQVALFLAGTFAVHRDLFEQVGRFAEECRSSQHTEFGLRLAPHCRNIGAPFATVDALCVRIHAHDDVHLRSDFQALLQGALYVIDAHEGQLRKCPRYHSDWCAVAAVYAAKLGEYSTTRGLLWKAIQSQPARPKNYARLVLACLPTFARHVWKLDASVRNRKCGVAGVESSKPQSVPLCAGAGQINDSSQSSATLAEPVAPGDVSHPSEKALAEPVARNDSAE